MAGIFSITFPFFALVLCGYLAARQGLLPLVAIPGLNAFVLYFALPCMLYRFGAATPVAQLLDGTLMAVYLVSALVMVAFTVAVTLGGKTGWNDAAFGALVAAFPNTGFMGVPLLVALLGPLAAGPAIATIIVDMVITSSLCIGLSRLGEKGAQGQQGAAQAARLALKGVVVNPMPWAIGLGTLASAAEFALPKPIMGVVSLLADAASPVALFTIGAVLARSQMSKMSGVSGGGRMPISDYLPVVLIKLVLHPLLLGLLGLGAIALGLPLERSALVVLILVASLPSASNVVLLTERFGADSERIARIILVSTVLAFFTFPGMALLLGR